MKLLKLLLTLAAAIVAFMLSVQVNSAPPDRLPPPPDYDMKSYPSSLCKPLYGQEQYAEFLPGMVRNADSTVMLALMCPIVRDDVTNTDGTDEIVVNIYQGVFIGPSMCIVYSFDEDHSIVESVTDTAVDPNFTQLNLELSESARNGYYELLCILSPSSSLYSYRVSEIQGSYSEMTDYNR